MWVNGMNRRDVLKRAPQLSRVAFDESEAQRRPQFSYVAASDLSDEEVVDSESELRAAPRLYVDEENERTRSPRQSYVAPARLRSFDEPTRIGVLRPSYVARDEFVPPSSELSESFPAPRRSHVAVKELHDEDRCDLETVTKHVVLPSTYVPSSEVEHVDAYASTEKFHLYTDAEEEQLVDAEEERVQDELSSEGIEVMPHDVLAHTDEQPVVEPERLDLDALGRYLFDDCGLPPVPEPPRPPSSSVRPLPPSRSEAPAPVPAPVFDRTIAVCSQPPPAQDSSLRARLAEIQRVMEQRQRALSVPAEAEVRPSSRRPEMPPPPPASWGSSVRGSVRHPTEPAMLFGLPTPPPRKSQSLKPVLASVAGAGLGLFIAMLIALALVFTRSKDSGPAAARAAVEAPTPVLRETVAADPVTAPPSFIVIGDPLDEPPAPPAASPAPSPRPATAAATPAAPAAPQKVAAPVAAKPEGAPAPTTTSRAQKSGAKSVEEILAELGEEQLRR